MPVGWYDAKAVCQRMTL